MNIPAMYYVGCIFNWIFVLLSIGGYLYIRRRTGKKWGFIPIFAGAWVLSGVSYIILINGAASGIWFITLLRVITYVLFLTMLIWLILELTKSGKRAA